ncbi:diacylglycerol kinase [Segeticoccus rhizosphaerae]|jgi:diacylglycerol kinase (ATP)|uniref:diacylglycerol kinase n=1 Tax=Segeticoccus rhizosphaerae TaxID=1104777 RepID=UPI0010BFEF18|nr:MULTISPECIES: diacylglycerol kinase [Intrasporangiaceae]
MTTRIGLLVNPTAGKGRGARAGAQIAARLAQTGHEIVQVTDETAQAAHDRGVAAVASGLDVLVVVGGDGMVHLGADLCAGSETALAIVGAGSGNDVARCLGLPVHDPEASATMIEAGHWRSVDLGRHLDADGDAHWFAGVLCAGFDAIVNERANGWVWPQGRMRYNLAIARELPVFRPIPYTVHIDGTRIDTEAMLVAVANGTSYGGGMRVCPDARLDDGLLDVFIVRKMSVPTLVRLFPRVYRGTHVDHPAVQIIQGRHVTLEADGITSYADGERFAPLPLSVEVAPGALRVVVPPG